MTVINPFDFFVEPYAETLSVRLRAGAREGADPVPRDRAARAAARRVARRVPRDDPARRERRSTAGAPQPAAAAARSATSCGWSRACRRPRRRSSARSGSCRDSGWLLVQILRHLGLAARFASGYLIQLVADVKPLDGPVGHRARLHRPARVGRGLSAGRGLDRPRSDVGAAGRRRPHSARVHRRPGQRGAGDRLHRRRATSSSTFAMSVTRVHEDPRVTKPYTDAQWAAIDALGEQVDARSRGARCAPDAGRRADVRLDRRHGRRGVELHRAVAEEARARPKRCCAGCARASRRGGFAALRARASGIRASRCRAGRSASTGAPTASRCGATTR